ncbi:uncharacterized protein [Triticum aestivum]|uniref:uncharacterized protein n=1 Tax=Triticum aestivum TaxID=4565 RepID=UPI001D033622|nr:uncharacterized protein LOC123100732 [Triticum aestivum]
MELRSGRRLRRSPPPPPHGASSSRRGPGGGADLISALPDEMLLLVLVRLRCVRAAVQTSLLSRRWRDVWTGLTDLSFRYLEPATIEAVLGRLAAASTPVSTIDVRLHRRETAYHANLLLRAAARLSPREMVFIVPSSNMGGVVGMIELPCFNRTASIELDTQRLHVHVGPPPAGEFTLLERLSLSGNNIDLSGLRNCCPRLSMLSVTSESSITLPPDNAYPALESLFLTGEIFGLDSLLHCCQLLRVLSVTYLYSQQLTLGPAGEFLALEKLSLDGNIVNLGDILKRYPRLRVLSATFRGVEPCSIEAALLSLEGAVALGLVLSLIGIHIQRSGGGHTTSMPIDSSPFCAGWRDYRHKRSSSLTSYTETSLPTCCASTMQPQS